LRLLDRSPHRLEA